MSSPPLAAIALLAGATLGYEILLTRLFSIIQWHHFAYMMISVAMLGFGAAGALVALAQGGWLRAHFALVFLTAATAFGFTAVAGFVLAQQIAFNPLELLWDPAQPLRLLAVYALLFVPFLCSATCTCLTFAQFGAQAHRIYACDLCGAGAGCLAILAALFVLAPMQALVAVGVAGFAGAAAAVRPCGISPRVLPAILLGGALAIAFALPSGWTALRPSPYKELSQTLAVSGTRIVADRSSPLGAITVVESPRIPFRYAPGQSIASTHEPPAQLALFTDGDSMSAINRFDGRASIAFLGDLTSAAPYSLRPRPRVLVLGAGAGADVLQALYHEAAAVDAVELDPQVIDLVEQEFAAFSGKPYSARGVRVHIAEARRFVASGTESYDLVAVALLDAFGATAAGLHALSESYLYTVEALETYVARLAPGGVLAITRWVTLPPRDMLKLFATAATALERAGVAQPGNQLALIRGWRTVTLLVRNGAFTGDDIAALKAFCDARSFDLDYVPGMRADEANRYNVLDRPWYYDGAIALLGPARDRFADQYKFDITPATDDRPFFFHFFKWRTLPELLALKERGGLPLLEWGYPVLIATLIQAAAAGALLILVPLLFIPRPASDAGTPTRTEVALYFLALGCGFMFIEIAFIQKLILFLGHPLLAVAVVLFAFLVFAGLGSLYAGRRLPLAAPPRSIARPVVAIGFLALVYITVSPRAFAYLIAQPDAVRIALSVAMIAPLAFAMGMPFPRGLAVLANRAPALIPWAWGINACASVVAAVLATLLALHLGFDAVVALAVLTYALAVPAGRGLLGG